MARRPFSARHARSRAGRVAGVAALAAGGALLLAACSSSTTSTASTPSSASRPSSTTVPAAAATVKVATTAYGKILETPSGQVLYALTANTPTKSACSGACLTIWPPLTVSGTPVAGSGVTSSDLGTFALSTGKSQVTYGGHQLYEYSGDTAAGQTNGEGLSFPVGASSPTGHWYVVSSSGAVVTSAVSSTSKSTTPTTAKSTSKSTSGNGY